MSFTKTAGSEAKPSAVLVTEWAMVPECGSASGLGSSTTQTGMDCATFQFADVNVRLVVVAPAALSDVWPSETVAWTVTSLSGCAPRTTV